MNMMTATAPRTRIDVAALLAGTTLVDLDVIPAGAWENDSGIPGWHAVSEETRGGIIAYFGEYADAELFAAAPVLAARVVECETLLRRLIYDGPSCSLVNAVRAALSGLE